MEQSDFINPTKTDREGKRTRLNIHSKMSMARKQMTMDVLGLTGAALSCVLVIALLLVTTGCFQTTSNPGLSRSGGNPTPTGVQDNQLMSIWRSPKATSRERAEALNKWLSPETSLESAISLLGPEGIVSRDHGPSTVLIQDEHGGIARKNGLYEKLWLHYKMPDGSVALSFHSQEGVSTEWRFEHAYVPGQITTFRTNWVQ